MARDMKPEEWGWHIDNQKFIPIQMDQPAAPSKLLAVICCSCKKDCSSGGAHVENMVCLALLFAMNAMALAALTHNAQISLMIWMTTVNSSAMQ